MFPILRLGILRPSFTDMKNLNFYTDAQKTKVSQSNLKQENSAGDTTLPDSKPHDMTIVMTACYWHIDRYTSVG